MTPTRRFLVVTGLLVTVVATRAIAQDNAQITSWIQGDTIFLTEIEQATPGEGCGQKTIYYYTSPAGSCRIKIRARVLRVLNDPGRSGLAPGEFESEVLPRARWSEPALGKYIWTGVGVGPGDRFVIFSHAAGLGFATMFEAPSGLYLLTGEDEVVADLELILSSSSLSPRQQASLAAEAVTSATKPRSPFLAQYALALICQASHPETADLARAIEDTKPSAFSDSAKRGLLWGLSNWVKTSREPRDAVLRLFATMAARYLVAAPDQPGPGEIDIRDSIVEDYVPLIIASERARAAFRAALTPDLASGLLAKIAALAGDTRFRPNEISRLRDLVVDSLKTVQR